MAATSLSIPEDLIFEILAKLAVKSLLKFKCVSRSWNSIISSKFFIKTHLKISLDSARYATISRSPEQHSCFCSTSELLDSLLDVRLYYGSGYRIVSYLLDNEHVVGAANGLSCIRVKNRFTLWNPATQKHWHLPNLDVEYTAIASYGFAFDESNDDYRVVVVYRGWSGDVVSSGTQNVQILSLRRNSWKLIGKNQNYLWNNTRAVFVNGKLHWNSSITREIVSVDVGKETVECFAGPPRTGYGEMDLLRGNVLDSLDGRLCVLQEIGSYYKFQCAKTDIWVMKEYAQPESWCLVTSVAGMPDPTTGLCHSCVPLRVLENGQILLRSGDVGVMLYDISSSTYTFLQPSRHCGCLHRGVTVESLVSPLPDDQDGENC